MRAILFAAAALALLAGLLAFLNAGGPDLPAGEEPARHAAPAVTAPGPADPADDSNADPGLLEEPEPPATSAVDDELETAWIAKCSVFGYVFLTPS